MAAWHTIGLIPSPGPWLEPAPADPVDLGNGVYLVMIPEPLTTAKFVADFGWEQIGLLAGDPVRAITVQYEAENLGDPEPRWKGPEPMWRQEYAAHLLQLANLALWLVLPGNTLHFRYLVHVQETEGIWHVRQWTTTTDRLYIGHRTIEPLTPEQLREASQLNAALGTVNRRGSLWIAVRCLWGALVQGWFHGRYVLLWIALEALFGPRDPGEVRHRLSQQLTFFLAEQPEARHGLYRAAKRDYVERSRVVHGEFGDVCSADRG